MNTSAVRFRCPKCQARIKAPVQIIGRSRDCPGCGRSVTIPRLQRKQGDTVVILVEGKDLFSLGIAKRCDDVPTQLVRPVVSRRSA